MSVHTGVRRRGIAAAAAAVAAAATIALLPTQAAQAASGSEAAGPWEPLLNRTNYARFEWVLPGRVPGVPGNAHSGALEVDGDDDGTIVTVNNWSCPAGVVPPLSYGVPTTCDPVESTMLEQWSTDVGDWGTWLVRSRLSYPVLVTDQLTGEESTGHLDVRIHGLDPNTREEEFRTYTWPDGSRHRDRSLRQKRQAVFSGSVLGISLRDPRLEVRRAEVSSWQMWTRELSPATP